MKFGGFNSLCKVVSQNDLIFTDIEGHIIKSIWGKLYISGRFTSKYWEFAGEFEIELNETLGRMGFYVLDRYLFFPVDLVYFQIENVQGVLYLMDSGAYRFIKDGS